MNTKQEYRDEKVLLGRIAQSDLSAYRYLFDTYFTDLCNFLFVYLRNQSFSEEIALDIFAHIWEKRKFIDIHKSLKGYLFTSAKNRAISFLRREKTPLFTDIEIAEDQLPVDSGSQFYIETKELKQIIEQAVNSLPEKSLQVYRMAWEENLSYREIAEKLGITVKTVENHVGIALRKLRTSLAPYYQQIFMLWLISLGN